MPKRTKIAEILTSNKTGEYFTVKGWVRTKRESKNIVFIALNDGSTLKNLQLTLEASEAKADQLGKVTTGASISVEGKLVTSPGSGQHVELLVSTIEVLGESPSEAYPLQRKRHSLEFLREIAHLRPRTNTFGAIFRIRNQLIYATHTFFQQKGFINIHTPILTGSDAEGAGETFTVTTLNLNQVPKDEKHTVDFTRDFFGKETKLAVSGQLEGELAALALSEIYTFGPTFRAENSNSSRHLAEFWMVEPEMAFYDLEEAMNLAEEMLRYLVRHVLNHCADDLAFLEKRSLDEETQKPQHLRNKILLTNRLRFVIDHPFERISYNDAIEILIQSKPNQKRKFQYVIEKWGADLQSEHERYLVEKHFKKPVIIFNYPKEMKAFYMRQNDDQKTVAAMDVLFPAVGELVGGSQREERNLELTQRINELGISQNELWWYLETRKFGTVPHSGFGLGFERLVQFVTGMSNIRDVIPFPRSPGNCEF